MRFIHYFLGCCLIRGVQSLLNITVAAKLNGFVTLPCRLPMPVEKDVIVQWFSRKDKYLTSGTVVYKHRDRMSITKPAANEWNLRIEKLDISFADMYTCHTDTNITVSIIELVIESAPKIDDSLSTPKLYKVSEGNSAIMRCIATGIPKPIVEWFRGKEGKSIGVYGSQLIIQKVERYASDVYKCRATNKNGEASKTINLDVTYEELNPGPRNADTQSVLDAIAESSSKSSEEFRQVREELCGVRYEMENMRSELKEMHGRKSFLDSKQKLCRKGSQDNPDDYRVEPVVNVMSSEVYATPGEAVVMSCIAQGPQISEVYWTDNRDRQIKTDWKYLVMSEDAGNGVPVKFINLIFRRATVSRHDYGTYTCKARNENNIVTNTVELKEKVEPEVNVMSSEVYAALGEAVVMSCVVRGSKNSEVYWTDNRDRHITTNWKYLVMSEDAGNGIPVKFINLIFRNATISRHDYGTYTCKARNENNIVTNTVELKEIVHTKEDSEKVINC